MNCWFFSVNLCASPNPLCSSAAVRFSNCFFHLLLLLQFAELRCRNRCGRRSFSTRVQCTLLWADRNRFLWPCCKLRHIDTSAWSRTRFVWVCESRERERNCQFLICPRSFSEAKMSITQGMYREFYKPYRSSLYERREREREKIRKSDYFSLLMAVWLEVLDWLSIKFFEILSSPLWLFSDLHAVLWNLKLHAVFANLFGGYSSLGELRIVCSLHYWHIVWALFVQDLSSTCPERSTVLKLKHCREN